MTDDSGPGLDRELQQQLAHLLDGVVNCSTRHLSEAENDLEQIGILLDEAGTRLTDSFFALHAAISAQQELVALVAGGGLPVAEIGPRLQAHANAIAAQVGAAVTSLQFQDMTNQLIDRTTRRIGGLRLMVCDTAAVASALRSRADGAVVHLQIDAVTARLARQSEMLDDTLFKSVEQKHLESGDIELF